MDARFDSLELLALAAVLLAILTVFLWVAASVRSSRRRRARLERASSSELEAAELLVAHGWTILETQPTCLWPLLVDGRSVEVESRADFLVRRDDRLLVADAKSGSRAPDPTLPATRRQLLEYLLAFEVDGVLLVDPAADRIVEVSFGVLAGGRVRPFVTAGPRDDHVRRWR